MNVIDWLAHRSGRERMLLAMLAAVILPAAMAFGLLLPLADQHSAARTALAEAQALNTWVAARAAEVPPAQTRAAPEAPQAAITPSALEQSLKSATLWPRVTRLDAQGDGGIALEFEKVPFVDLMAWLDGMHPDWGYDITGLRMEPLDTPAQVSAVLGLEAAASDP